jgi:hypothetical protein
MGDTRRTVAIESDGWCGINSNKFPFSEAIIGVTARSRSLIDLILRRCVYAHGASEIKA